MKKVYLLTDNDIYFADHLKFPHININEIIKYFKDVEIDINILKLQDLPYLNKVENSIILTISSQKPYHRFYFNDINYYLSKENNNILVPSYEMIKAHENKGYQELYKNILGIESLKAFYVNNNTINYEIVEKELSYPLVLKTIDGAGSKGVKLVKSRHDLRKNIEKIHFTSSYRNYVYIYELLKRFFKIKPNQKKLDYCADYNNFIVQEFIPNLKFDYKVLVFFDKYYVLKRNISNNDFRASGSGKFEFVDIEDSLLDYAHSISETLNEPFLSLDICYDEKKYYLIEYQGIHFGQYTQLHSDGYYILLENNWKFISEKKSLEFDLFYSLHSQLQKIQEV